MALIIAIASRGYGYPYLMRSKRHVWGDLALSNDKQSTRLALFSRICTYTNEARDSERRLC